MSYTSRFLPTSFKGRSVQTSANTFALDSHSLAIFGKQYAWISGFLQYQDFFSSCPVDEKFNFKPCAAAVTSVMSYSDESEQILSGCSVF